MLAGCHSTSRADAAVRCNVITSHCTGRWITYISSSMVKIAHLTTKPGQAYSHDHETSPGHIAALLAITPIHNTCYCSLPCKLCLSKMYNLQCSDREQRFLCLVSSHKIKGLHSGDRKGWVDSGMHQIASRDP